MNPRLNRLHPYPFERLNALLADVSPPADLDMIPLSLGEPKHEAPTFLVDMLRDEALVRDGIGTYPQTRGIPTLRSAIAGFLKRRFDLASIDPDSQILPVNGTREALFAFAQAVIDSDAGGVTLMPNPFYQIYEGAALLAGSTPRFLNCTAENGFMPDWDSVSDETWQATQLVYLCTPGNPTGAVMSEASLLHLIAKSDEHNFVIASDECYSELWYDTPPQGLLGACAATGRHDYRNCVAFNSLSKRSNLPGLRSGYVAGDAAIIERFLLYRTYHGSAMPALAQHVSAAAWQDDAHAEANRLVYAEKYRVVLPLLDTIPGVSQPAAGFYLWPETPEDDETFTRELWRSRHVKVIPGSYLARDAADTNPGAQRIRLALVAPLARCVEAAERLATFYAGR